MIYVTHDQIEAMTMGDRICVLNYGKIMQVDTPLDLYHRPNNKFVTSFIGAPAMNILEIELFKEDGQVGFNLGDTKLMLPSDKAKKLEHKIGKKVWFGIRPENIKTSDNNKSSNIVEGVISVVELMGNEEIIYFDLDGIQFTARQNSTGTCNINVLDEMKFHFDLNNCHIFDHETEENITL